jgi:hypothetical protein
VIQLIDDQLLGRVLRRDGPPHSGAEVFTTGYWYVRLCQAVLNASGRTGILSAPFVALPEYERSLAINGLLELPDEIGLLSLRELGPVIGQLRARHDLNILSMEALAAATRLGAAVFLSAPSPRLEAALKAEGVGVTVAR